MTGLRAHRGAALALRAALALAVAAAVAPGVAVAGGSLAGEYVGLGGRMGDRSGIASVAPRPIAFPERGPAARYPLRGPTEVRIARGGVLIVAESMTGRVLRVGPEGRVSVLRGRKAYDFALCGGAPAGGVGADRAGNRVYRGRTSIAGTGRTGFAGDGGPATAARLNGPTCAVTAADGGVLVADQGNRRVRRIAPDGTIATIAEGLVPQAIAALPDGGALVTDTGGARVLQIRPDGTLTTFAGTGARGFDGDGGPARAARLTMPWGIARAVDGTVFVSDFGSETVRRISPDGTITTVLGAPPQPAAAPSRAESGWVPSRRLVSHWINPEPGTWSSGERGTSDESASGGRAVIRSRGYGGDLAGIAVVAGRHRWDYGVSDMPCWGTPTGVRGDPLQARDLQAGAGAPAPYAPGPGPYAPDLVRGGLVLARAPIVLDARPVFGEPAWWTEWRAQRLVDYFIDRRTGRVVAVQAWSARGFERQYRIRPVPRSRPLRAPATRPRMHYFGRTATAVGMRCGPARDSAPSAFGYARGIALARRVNRRLDQVAAVHARAVGRSDVGRPFTATSDLALERGRIRAGITRVAAPGRPQPNVMPPGGSYTLLTPASGGALYRFAGASCWIGDQPEDGPVAPAVADLSRVMPLEDAFFELPRRSGRLVALRAYTDVATVVSLIDPRDMRLVAQRWISSRDRGVVRLTETAAAPALPEATPACPERGAAPTPAPRRRGR